MGAGRYNRVRWNDREKSSQFEVTLVGKKREGRPRLKLRLRVAGKYQQQEGGESREYLQIKVRF